MVVSIKDFVKASLLEIAEAVVEARNEARVNIAPGYVEGLPQLEPQNVHFELLVEVIDQTKIAGEAHATASFLGVIKAGVGTDGQLDKSASNSQKIAFSVPVYFQSPKNKEDQ